MYIRCDGMHSLGPLHVEFDQISKSGAYLDTSKKDQRLTCWTKIPPRL